ncbi:branched-chain amino acid ABC transporter permease [Candidatus Bipolaricaulota bacterium]|nr:branched-chain amino acid ABC transporter permease [Candidatus Bipolaricaulota bacterium]
MELVSQILFGLLNGVTWGILLALISSGLNVIFGLLGIVNVAHGSFYMVGAYLAWLITTQLGSFWLALFLAPLIVGMLGILAEFILKPVEQNHTLSVLGTFGVTLALQGSALTIWGGAPKRLSAPVGWKFSLFGTGYSYYRIIAAAISLITLICLWFLLERTDVGLKFRAVQEDPELSVAAGIRVPLVYSLGFGLGAALAGLSGALVAPTVSITPEMGLRIFAIVFLIVIAGGLGRIWNAVLFAIVFSVVRGLLTTFFNPTAALIATFVLVLVFLLLRKNLPTSRG